MLKNLVILLLLCIITANGWSQSYFIERIPLNEFITNSSVEDIFQDSEGFIWFATHTGLVQYSGSFARVFSPGSSEGQRTVPEFFYKITEDKNRNLWIASRNGLVFIDSTRNKTKTFLASPEFPLPNNRIFDVFIYNDTTFFLACDRAGIVVYNPNKHELSFPQPDWKNDAEIPTEVIWARQYWKTENDLLIIRTNQMYLAYDPINNKVEILKDETLENFSEVGPVRTLTKDRNGHFWLVNQNCDLFRWTPQKELVKYSDPDFREACAKGIFQIFEFDQSKILLPTNGGDFLFNKETGQINSFLLRSKDYFSPPKNRTVAFCRTNEDHGFISFRAGITGLINPINEAFKFNFIEKKVSDELLNVSFVLEDDDYKRRFISTFQYPFIIIEDLQSGKNSEIPKVNQGNLTSNRMVIGNKGDLWACQGKGILKIDRATLKTEYFEPDSPSSQLFDIVEFSEGEFFVSSFTHGLYYFNPEKNIFSRFQEIKGWIKTQIYCLEKDHNRNCLWIGTVRNGLFKYDIGRDTFYQFLPEIGNPSSIGGDWLRSMVLHRSGDLWISADPTGISVLSYNDINDYQFKNLSLADGLPSNFISGMVLDSIGNIWVSSLAGIASINPSDLTIKTYQPDNGARNQTFFYSNLSVNSSGKIFLGSSDGYYEFNPQNLTQNETPPSVRLVGFDILQSDRTNRIFNPIPNEIHLKHTENYFAIEFAVINFIRPEKNEIFYKIDESSNIWQKATGIDQIYFSQLAPGNYIFRLKARNEEGVWSENEIVLPITIAKPFYANWWFFVLTGSTVAFFVYLGYLYKLRNKLRENHLKAEKETIKSKMEKQLADLKLLSLRSQMNPHFIFNCLNSINRFILINDNDAASEYLTKFSRLIRKVLDNSREDKITLEKDIETLKLYIEMEKMRFIKKFDYLIQLDETLNGSEIKIQPMLIQPFVENAIWHGLMHRDSKGLLEIIIGQKDDKLYIQVKDNGIGRKQSKKIRSGLQFKHKSYGMRVTEERMEMEKYHSSFYSRSKITDLYHKDATSAGTLVEIFLPMETVNTNLEKNKS